MTDMTILERAFYAHNSWANTARLWADYTRHAAEHLTAWPRDPRKTRVLAARFVLGLAQTARYGLPALALSRLAWRYEQSVWNSNGGAR